MQRVHQCHVSVLATGACSGPVGVAGSRGCGLRGRQFWQGAGDARKIVVSNQNLQFTWRNSEQLKGDLVEAVSALKNEPGTTDIAMSGSASVVRQLLDAGLLDELHLLVHPAEIPPAARRAVLRRSDTVQDFGRAVRPSPQLDEALRTIQG
jgi:hypothetical protein